MSALSHDEAICRIVTRDIAESERGAVATLNDLPAWMVDEVLAIARESIVSAVRYLRFYVPREHASHVPDFVEDVGLKGQDAPTWRIRDCIYVPNEHTERTAIEVRYLEMFDGVNGERWSRVSPHPADHRSDSIVGMVGTVMRDTRYWEKSPPGLVRYFFTRPDRIERVSPDRLESSLRRWIAHRLAWWTKVDLQQAAAITGDELIMAVPGVDLGRVTSDAKIAAAALAREAQAFGDSPSFPQQAGFLGPEEWYR
jgi:hypothetical protein